MRHVFKIVTENPVFYLHPISHSASTRSPPLASQKGGSSFPCAVKPKHHSTPRPLSMPFTISRGPQSPPLNGRSLQAFAAFPSHLHTVETRSSLSRTRPFEKKTSCSERTKFLDCVSRGDELMRFRHPGITRQYGWASRKPRDELWLWQSCAVLSVYIRRGCAVCRLSPYYTRLTLNPSPELLSLRISCNLPSTTTTNITNPTTRNHEVHPPRRRPGRNHSRRLCRRDCPAHTHQSRRPAQRTTYPWASSIPMPFVLLTTPRRSNPMHPRSQTT